MKLISAIKWSVPGVLAIGGIAAGVTIRGSFDRPGESAFSLIPADATAVASLDLVPSTHQVVAFSKLQAALDKAGKGHALEQVITEAIDSPKVGAALAPLIKRSAALAMFGMPSDKNVPIVGIVAVSDGQSAERALLLGFKPISDQYGTYFKSPSGTYYRVAGSYVEITTDRTLYARLDAVGNGTKKPITSLASFQVARDSVSRGANLKGFFRQGNTWITASGSIQNDGIKLAVKGLAGSSGLSPSSIAKPFDAGFLHKLPSGSYGLFSVSQASVFGRQAMSGKDSDMKSLVSALLGDITLAFYPSGKSPRAGLDVMLILDSANGAKPALAFKTLVKSAAKHFTDGKPIFKKPHKMGDAYVADLAPSLSDTMTGSLKDMGTELKPGIVSDKTVSYATIGQTLVFTSSHQLLKRSIATYEGSSPSLAVDPAYARVSRTIKNGDQVLLAVDMNRVQQGVTNSVNKDNETAKQFKDGSSVVINGDQTIELSLGAQKNGSWHAELFVPVNYNQLAWLLTRN